MSLSLTATSMFSLCAGESAARLDFDVGRESDRVSRLGVAGGVLYAWALSVNIVRYSRRGRQMLVDQPTRRIERSRFSRQGRQKPGKLHVCRARRDHVTQNMVRVSARHALVCLFQRPWPTHCRSNLRNTSTSKPSSNHRTQSSTCELKNSRRALQGS